MTILHIEHPISDFTTWKTSFDRFAGLRQEFRVRSFEITQPVDDPAYVMIRLELDTLADTNALVARLRALWTDGVSTPALRGAPRVAILERKERTQL